MALNLEPAKQISQYFETIVSGYIHQIQSTLLHEENSFDMIPELINTTILIFYYGEYFAEAGDGITIHGLNANIISYHKA